MTNHIDPQALASSPIASIVQELADKQRIHDALMRYCRGVDRRQADLIASVFWPDATIDTGGTIATSGVEFPAAAIAGMERLGALSTMHFIGNESVELAGERAFSETYVLSYMTLLSNDDPHTRVRGSRYLDMWTARSGEWRVIDRLVVDDWVRFDPVGAETPHGGRHHGTPGSDDAVLGRRQRWLAGLEPGHST